MNVGIECDEAHHLDDTNKNFDKIREANIFDVLHEIGGSGYVAKHIDVTKGFYEVGKQIDQTIDFLKKKIIEVKPIKWEFKSSESYYKNKQEITVFDKHGFKSINETCNILFSAGRNEKATGPSKSYFSLPAKFRNTELENYKLWFPKLAVTIKENGVENAISVSKGWNNQMNSDGTQIEEFNENGKLEENDDHKTRIVFAQYRDPLGTMAYKFVGIFVLDHFENNGKRIYKREADRCTLIKE